MSRRNSMRQVREVLRLKHKLRWSLREIEAVMGVSRSSVSDYLTRAAEAGLTWDMARELKDSEVEERLFHRIGSGEASARAPVDFATVHRELRRPGVTRRSIWSEYQEAAANGLTRLEPYQYSQFCDLYRRFRAKVQPSMRRVHQFGYKIFCDFLCKGLSVFNPMTGEAADAALFIMVLGASSYTYAEATRTPRFDEFVAATVRGLEHFQGAPEILVANQLRSTTRAMSWYEPEVIATLAEVAEHYGMGIVPPRARKRPGTVKVEAGVLVAERWMTARLCHRTFSSLEELNVAIAHLSEELNTRPFKNLEGCRRSLFESLDRPALRPLPPRRYERRLT